MRYLYSLLLIPVIAACSGTVDLLVSGSANTGIVFELSKSDAKKLDTGFKFYVMDNSTVPEGDLKKVVWEVQSIRKRSWFDFKNDYTDKWTYGIKPDGFNELVKPETLSLNTYYYYSLTGGRGYRSSGCFYLNDKKIVVDSKTC